MRATKSTISLIVISIALCLSVCGQGAAKFEYREIEPVEVKTGKHARVSFMFPDERVGYFTVKGVRIGDGLVATNSYVAKIQDNLEREDVTFHAVKCPRDLSSLSFECSDGNLAAFWESCLRLTENRIIAKAMGDTALEKRFSEELTATFSEAMPKANATANPLGAIVRQYLGISAIKENGTIDIFPKLVQGMTRMAGKIPTSAGLVKVDARHLRGDDFTIDVEIPTRLTARVITPVWGEGCEVDGKKASPKTVAIDSRKRYVFQLRGGKHAIRLVAPPKKAFPQPATAYDMAKIQLEKLGRGFVAFSDGHDAILSWRYLPSDPRNIAFDIYEDGRKINLQPISATTFHRTKYREGARYELVVSGSSSQRCASAVQSGKPYLKIPLKPMPDGYWTEEASVGDVDGDGEYELVVKRTPSNAHDNAQSGMTDPTLLECYKLDGTFLWQINLGRNIRSGAHYTQFMVYDFDGDGKAEMICKTADGTIDGRGDAIGDRSASYANDQGRILDGPEFLTLFDGITGKALDTVPYDPPRGNIQDWGDDYGNRCDRFLACVAYLDGIHPSAVFCRGYYAKTVLVAWDVKGKKLVKRWKFDSGKPGNEAYGKQGFHSVRAGDVDFDGKDEIIYGAMVVDDDGNGLYSTGLGHGDGMHLVQARPDLRGLQVWTCHEHAPAGLVFRYAGDGRIIWQQKRGYDVPTCVAADFDPTNPGYELWMGKNEPYWDAYGRALEGIGHIGWERDLAWWKGDMLRSRIENGRKLFHWDWGEKRWKFEKTLRTDASGLRKLPFPILVADILGDWREEIVTTTDDGNALSVFVSPHETPYRFWTFMADPIYRLSVASWNVAYNQATQAGFYFGPDLLGHGIWFRGTFLP